MKPCSFKLIEHSFYMKIEASNFWNLRVTYDTRKLIFVAIAHCPAALRGVPPQHSSSAFPTFYVQICACSVLKISSRRHSRYDWWCFFVIQPRHFLRKSDKLLSTRIELHRSPITNIFCNISLFEIVWYHMTPSSFQNMEPPVFRKDGDVWYMKKEGFHCK